MSPQETEAFSKKCPHCGLINPETARDCDCGYEFVAVPLATELVARTRSVRRRRLTIIFLAIVIPILAYLLLTSLTNPRAEVRIVLAGILFTISSYSAIRAIRLEYKLQMMDDRARRTQRKMNATLAEVESLAEGVKPKSRLSP